MKLLNEPEDCHGLARNAEMIASASVDHARQKGQANELQVDG